jgi:hypothetical protein
VFGKAGYLLTWPQRIAKFGITPETFQAALAQGVPAVPLTPVAKPSVEKTIETTRSWYSRLAPRFLCPVSLLIAGFGRWPAPTKIGAAFLMRRDSAIIDGGVEG